MSAAMPADRLMDADEMVDAALAGLDIGQAVTIPSLPGYTAEPVVAQSTPGLAMGL